jgi:hypothetical protein
MVMSVSSTSTGTGNVNTAWRFLHKIDPICGQKSEQYPLSVNDKRSGMSVRYIIPYVQIGNNKWMQYNLDVTQYRNGDVIPQITNATAWAAATTGAWCWYGFSYASYGSVYGKLYNWYAVNDVRGLAPLGWHIPSDYEWQDLISYLGGGNSAGNKLKESGTDHWSVGNAGNNSTGLTVIPGGSISTAGAFSGMNSIANFWSATSDLVDGNSLSYRLISSASAISRVSSPVANGYSVRCIRYTEGSVNINFSAIATLDTNLKAVITITNSTTGEVAMKEYVYYTIRLNRAYSFPPGNYIVSFDLISSNTGYYSAQICDLTNYVTLYSNTNVIGDSYNLTAALGINYSISVASAGTGLASCLSP